MTRGVLYHRGMKTQDPLDSEDDYHLRSQNDSHPQVYTLTQTITLDIQNIILI